MAKKNFLTVKIFFPSLMEKENLTLKATSVSSENRLGPFDVLPGHINFISLIFKKISIQTEKKEKIEFSFERGVMIVKENKVKVFLGV